MSSDEVIEECVLQLPLPLFRSLRTTFRHVGVSSGQRSFWRKNWEKCVGGEEIEKKGRGGGLNQSLHLAY